MYRGEIKMEYAIELKNVTKKFKDKIVFENLNLNVEKRVCQQFCVNFVNTESKLSIGEGTEKYFSSSFQFIILMMTFIISMGLIGILDLVSKNSFSFENKSSKNAFLLMITYIGYMSLFQIFLLIFLENKWLIILLISWIINILLIKTIVKRYKNKSEI